ESADDSSGEHSGCGWRTRMSASTATKVPPAEGASAHDHPQSGNPEKQFHHDAAVKSADLVHREIIRKNMESYDVGHMKGRSRFSDWEAARQACQAIKREAINHLDKYLL